MVNALPETAGKSCTKHEECVLLQIGVPYIRDIAAIDRTPPQRSVLELYMKIKGVLATSVE